MSGWPCRDEIIALFCPSGEKTGWLDGSALVSFVQTDRPSSKIQILRPSFTSRAVASSGGSVGSGCHASQIAPSVSATTAAPATIQGTARADARPELEWAVQPSGRG